MYEPEPSSGKPADSKVGGITAFIRSILGRDTDTGIKENLEDLLEEHDERVTPLDPDERRLISNILYAADKTVKDVMIPRADVCALSVTVHFDEVVEVVTKSPHSRYPVYKSNLDNTIGMVHIKDVLAALVRKKKTNLQTLVRPVIFVVPNMRILDLLLKMRMERKHMAIVVDEFGGIDGLVTIENVVEEIVGNIEDEHDVEDKTLFVKDTKGGISLDARYSLEDLQKSIGTFVSKEEAQENIDTVGGLIVHTLGRIPSRGEIVRHQPSGLEFKVIQSDPRRILRLYIRNAFAKKKK